MEKIKDELLKRLKEIEDQKATAIKNQNYELAANYRDRATEIRKQLQDIENKHSI